MIPSRLLAATLIRTARPALQVSCRKFPHRYQRSFSVTPRFQATPTDGIEAFTAAFKKTSVFKKLANHPEAITALESFARALQDAGVDLASGKQPSAMKMMKLAANSDFRASMKRVVDEMKKAGVDFTSKEVMEEIMSLKEAAKK